MKILSVTSSLKKQDLSSYAFVSFGLFAVDILVFFLLQFDRFISPLYLNESVNLLFYLGLSLSAVLHLFYLAVDKKILFPFLVVGKFIAIFVCFYTGLLPDSVFLLVASVYISFVGILYGASPAFLFCVLASFLLALNIVFHSILEPAILWGQFVFSHVLFFITAYLSPHIIKKIQHSRKELEEKKQDVLVLKNLNELIVNNIQAGLLTINSALVIQAANKQAVDLLESGPLEACDLLAFFPDIAKKINLLFVSSIEAKPLSSGVFEEVYQGKYFEVLISAMNYEETNNRIYTLLIQDITKKKRKEVADRQKEKLAVVGSLAASIAHEIRNPLAGISGSVQMLKGSSNLGSAESKQLFGIVFKEVERLNHLITEFLDYSVEKPLLISSVNISELIKEILKLLQRDKNYSSNIKHKLSVSSSIFIEGDVLRLKQSLLNFFINAYQAMKDSVNPVLSVNVYFEGSYVVLDIKDNGCGMSEEDKLKIFEPFFTNKINGTGLGLATSYNILQQHKCEISVKTEIDKGTLFRLKFPVFKYLSPENERMKVA